MLNFEPPVDLHLAAGRLLRWQQREAFRLRVLRGRVWVTRPGELDDHFVDAGQALPLRPLARILISAEHDARLVFEREPLRQSLVARCLAAAKRWRSFTLAPGASTTVTSRAASRRPDFARGTSG
jgi:hypothetical protein